MLYYYTFYLNELFSKIFKNLFFKYLLLMIKMVLQKKENKVTKYNTKYQNIN